MHTSFYNAKFAGQVQPHLALAKELSKHGHRVRVATNAVFRDYVSGAGLEFFTIDGETKGSILLGQPFGYNDLLVLLIIYR